MHSITPTSLGLWGQPLVSWWIWSSIGWPLQEDITGWLTLLRKGRGFCTIDAVYLRTEKELEAKIIWESKQVSIVFSPYCLHVLILLFTTLYKCRAFVKTGTPLLNRISRSWRSSSITRYIDNVDRKFPTREEIWLWDPKINFWPYLV